jgi:hypothetical protein
MNPLLTPDDQQELNRLLIAIEVNQQQTGLIFAISDDVNLWREVTKEYEADLQSQGMVAEQAWIDRDHPSLYHLLDSLERPTDRSVVTVLGANELSHQSGSGKQTAQEAFFYSLQWTREALLKFNYPIILWLTNGMATALAQQSPDFWSWRAGVFEFQGNPTAIEPDPDDLDAGLIVEYKNMARKLEQQAPVSPLLLSFYDKIGDYDLTKGNLESALHYYQLSLKISRTHGFTEDIATYQEKAHKVEAQMAEVANIKTITLSSLPTVEFAGPWYRINRREYSSLYFSNHDTTRYASADVPILYVASDCYGAFIETFGYIPKKYLSSDLLSGRKISVITTDRPLLFADFTGHGLGLIGQKITALYGDDRAISKQLAKAIALHPAGVDGIKYRSARDLNRFLYLIFERAARYLQAEELGTLMDYNQSQLYEILEYYGFGISE